LLIPSAFVPVVPALWIVLTVRVIVAALRVSQLIAAVNKRCALRKHQEQQRVLQLLHAQLPDCRLSALSLSAAVPGIIPVASVTVILTVVLIMLALVGNHIVHCKSVVLRHVIDHAAVCRIPAYPRS